MTGPQGPPGPIGPMGPRGLAGVDVSTMRFIIDLTEDLAYLGREKVAV